MGAVRTGVEFRMGLRGNKEGMGRNFNPFDDALIRRESDWNKTILPEGFPIIVVNFITMTVTFADILLTIEFAGNRAWDKMAGIGAKSPCPAKVFHLILFRP